MGTLAPIAVAVGASIVVLAAVLEVRWRRALPFSRWGRLATWRHPSRGPFARLADALANSRVVGALLEPLPELEMRSDITDVVYVNYVVPAERLVPLVPPGLELQRLGPDGRYGLFTFLTYRHGHFGFAILGPLRRLMPSPIQTNWRIHVRDPRTRHEGITFLTNAITSAPLALGARLISEGMPMHVLSSARLARESDGTIQMALVPGRGSAPDAEATLRPTAKPRTSEAFDDCWPSFDAFLAYCVPQNRAMSSQPHKHRVARQEIEIPIRLETCQPLEGEVISRAAAEIVGDARPICFRVPAVPFRFRHEAHDPMP